MDPGNLLDSLNYANQSFQNLNASLEAIANRKAQERQLEYQKTLNNQTMQREDTAISRMVKDLESAGLSKTLAAGTTGYDSGYVNAGQAPQMDSVSRFAAAASISKTMADTRYVNELAANEGIRGQVMGAQGQLYLAQVAGVQADALLKTGQAAYLGVSARVAAQQIEESKARSRTYLVSLGLTEAEIRKIESQITLNNAQEGKIGAETITEYLRQENIYLTNQQINVYMNKLLAEMQGIQYSNLIKQMEGYWMANTGTHMATWNNDFWSSFGGVTNLPQILGSQAWPFSGKEFY